MNITSSIWICPLGTWSDGRSRAIIMTKSPAGFCSLRSPSAHSLSICSVANNNIMRLWRLSITTYHIKKGMFLFSFDDEYEQNNDQKRRIFSILMAFQMFSIWEDKEFHIGCWAILTPEGDTSKTFMRMVFIYNISQVEDNQPTSNSNFWEILRWFGGKLIRLMMNLSAHNQTPLSRESANIADHFCNILN